ncbi:MAG TPA: YitT family protein [Acidimicrobiia bacterium]|jgi:uncharacterized membrane-anchored protein YitT (DUF2179 family)|nr:YitT family protein [Acidimicrobiia bacterium]
MTNRLLNMKLPLPPPTKPQVVRVASDFLMLTIGAVLLVYAFRAFMLPYGIAGGGVGGMALVVNDWTGFAPGLTMMVLNVPVLVLGYRMLGRLQFLVRTAYVVAIYNVGVDTIGALFPAFESDDFLLMALFGGVVSGIGAGLVFRAGGTAAGTGVISRIIQLRTGLPVSQIYLMLDGVIIAMQGLTFGWEKALYGVVLLFVNGLALDYVLEGPSVVRTLTIVTDKPDLVAGVVYDTMRVGVTEWRATGMYTDEDRHILFCTVSRAEAGRLVEAIQDADPDAFTVIGHAHQRRGGMVR